MPRADYQKRVPQMEAVAAQNSPSGSELTSRANFGISCSRNTLCSLNYDDTCPGARRKSGRSQAIFGGPLRSGGQGRLVMNPLFVEEPSTAVLPPTPPTYSPVLNHPSHNRPGKSAAEDTETSKAEAYGTDQEVQERRQVFTHEECVPHFVTVFTVSRGEMVYTESAPLAEESNPSTSSFSSKSSSSRPVSPAKKKYQNQTSSSSAQVEHKHPRPDTAIYEKTIVRNTSGSLKTQGSQTEVQFSASNEDEIKIIKPSSSGSDTSDSDKRRTVSFLPGTLDNEDSQKPTRDRTHGRPAKKAHRCREGSRPKQEVLPVRLHSSKVNTSASLMTDDEKAAKYGRKGSKKNRANQHKTSTKGKARPSQKIENILLDGIDSGETQVHVESMEITDETARDLRIPREVHGRNGRGGAEAPRQHISDKSGRTRRKQRISPKLINENYEAMIRETVGRTRRRRACQLSVFLLVAMCVIGTAAYVAVHFAIIKAGASTGKATDAPNTAIVPNASST